MSDTIPFTPATAKPDPDVIEALEEALALAKSGELRTVALVGELAGLRTFTTFTMQDMQRQIGAVSFLHHTLCARQRENREETGQP